MNHIGIQNSIWTHFRCCILGINILCMIFFGVTAFTFLMVVYSGGTTTTFLVMNLFEMCIDVYFPSMGTMKWMILTKNKRATIFNLFRVPLNFIALFSLLTDLTPKVLFILWGSMMIFATILQMKLKARLVGAWCWLSVERLACCMYHNTSTVIAGVCDLLFL